MSSNLSEVIKSFYSQGYRIPKGALVIFDLRSIQWDEEYWGDPHVFRPERFIKEGKLVHYERMIPFGKGKRSCIGEPLVKMSSLIMLSTLVQKFKFSFTEKGGPKDTRGITGFTVNPPEFDVRIEQR